MLIRSVVGHKIHQELHVALVQSLQQLIEIVECAEYGIDTRVIRNVITEIRHRRWINRTQPNCSDTQRDQVIESLDNSWKIPNAIAIGILKRPGVDLVDGIMFPPQFLMRHFSVGWLYT